MTDKRIFDTAVQKLKYDVLKAVIRNEYEHCYENIYIDIPKEISPGPKATMRCCIYKERAIVQERIKLAQGGDKNNPNVVEVIDIACDECPIGGIFVTPACRGCIVHRCKEVCPRDAIQIIDHKAVVDKSKCIECGKCTQACPYGAIIAQKRPCVNSCKVKAISVGEDKKAVIDNQKCISCGACVYQCPFGAIVDKSMVLESIDILKNSENNQKYHVYAVIAPSIVSQFKYAKIEQVVTGMRKLGFHQVVEAALGADITLYHEAEELIESLPDKSQVDKKQLEINLYISQGKIEEAARAEEERLLAAAGELQTILLGLLDIALKEERMADAEYIAGVSQKAASLLDLWEYNSYVAHFQLYMAAKNRKECLKILIPMLNSLTHSREIS